MKPRSVSPVAAVNVTSNVILSSLAPIASAIIAADSANTSLSRRTFSSARPRVSESCENPIAVCVCRRFVGRAVHRLRDADFVHTFTRAAEHHADHGRRHIRRPGVAAALTAGADRVWVGTALVAALEANA